MGTYRPPAARRHGQAIDWHDAMWSQYVYAALAIYSIGTPSAAILSAILSTLNNVRAAMDLFGWL